MAATADDYIWFEQEFPSLAEAFCLTFVRGVQPVEFLRRLDATFEGRLDGLAALAERTWATWDQHAGDRLFIGATDVGEWTVGVEFNGWLGVDETLLGQLSRGTTVVSQFENVNAVSSFYWIEDGSVRLQFDPLFAFDRDGTDSDSMDDVLQQVGFDLDSGQDRSIHLVTEAALALAGRLTGISLTPELLTTSAYACGIATVPRS